MSSVHSAILRHTALLSQLMMKTDSLLDSVYLIHVECQWSLGGIPFDILAHTRLGVVSLVGLAERLLPVPR